MRKHGEATKASIAWLLSFVSLYSLRGFPSWSMLPLAAKAALPPPVAVATHMRQLQRAGAYWGLPPLRL